MSNIQKTFSDSYVYNYDKNNNGKLIAKEINRKLIEYITTAERIDKKSEMFEGIKQEVKRQQSTSLMYSILMRDDVVLMVNTNEMARAFKVFEAIDIREIGKQRKVFIDVTGLIVEKNGYYVCKDIFRFITYLTQAVTYLLYRNDIQKMLNNSNITIAATECYIECFSFILDYLRIIGYSDNKAKIQYLIGLFFLNNLMGKELDTYTKNVCAKIVKLNPAAIKAYELYYDKEDFTNIDTFIAMLVENFKLKGLTTEVFITRWMYHFAKGTEYGIDLFTSFCNMISAAYCGAYVVYQKQIEKCCGRSMIKLVVSILELGSADLDKSYWSEAAMKESRSYYNPEIKALADSIKMRSYIPENTRFYKEDFSIKDSIEFTVKNFISYYNESKQSDKISSKLSSVIETGLSLMDTDKFTENYEVGCLETIIAEGKKYFTDKDKSSIISKINYKIKSLSEAIKLDSVKENEDLRVKLAGELSELRNSLGKLN